MLLWLAEALAGPAAARAVADAIIIRSLTAALLGSTTMFLFGPRLIRWLRERFCEPIHTASARLNKLHQHKRHTPTMGGLLILGSITLAVLLAGDLRNGYVLQGLLLSAGMTVVGLADDLIKLRSERRGLRPLVKLLCQTAAVLPVAIGLYSLHGQAPGGLQLGLPFAGAEFSLGLLYIPWAILVMIGSANAVNLTDGLDGLATGCLLCATAATGAIVYAGGTHAGSAREQWPHIPGAGEMLVVAAAMLGALAVFLCFNRYPARVFMGDTGSLPLGALLALIALAGRRELLLVIIGGVFVVEAVSVLLQVGFYKWTKRRILLCAPLHHHFQFLDWPENRIVVRFWIAAGLCALLGMGTLR